MFGLFKFGLTFKKAHEEDGDLNVKLGLVKRFSCSGSFLMHSMDVAVCLGIRGSNSLTMTHSQCS